MNDTQNTLIESLKTRCGAGFNDFIDYDDRRKTFLADAELLGSGVAFIVWEKKFAVWANAGRDKLVSAITQSSNS